MIRHESAVIRGLRTLFADGTTAGLDDRELLVRFVTHGDEAAFEAIVTRFGPLVLSICRSVARSLEDADDAFQATFLLLVQKAGSIRDGVLPLASSGVPVELEPSRVGQTS